MNQGFLQTISKKLKGLSTREQVLLIAAAGAVLYALADIVIFQQQVQQTETLRQKAKSQQAQVSALQQQSQQLNDPNFKAGPAKNEAGDLLQQLATIEAVERAIASGPPKLDAVFEDLRAKQHPKVQVQRIKTIPSRAITTSPAAGPTKAGAKKDVPAQLPTTPLTAPGGTSSSGGAISSTIYRHGIELEVRGAYLDVLAYLKTLEQRHPPLFWSDITLTAQTYPENTMRVTLYLLSRQPGLGI